MYPQREQRYDRSENLTLRSSRDYSRSANFILDAPSSGTPLKYPRPEKWINGRVRIIVWAEQDGSTSIYLTDNSGTRTLARTITWTVTTPGTMQEFEFFANSEIFEVDGNDNVIEVDGPHDSLRLQYFPRYRQ